MYQGTFCEQSKQARPEQSDGESGTVLVRRAPMLACDSPEAWFTFRFFCPPPLLRVMTQPTEEQLTHIRSAMRRPAPDLQPHPSAQPTAAHPVMWRHTPA